MFIDEPISKLLQDSGFSRFIFNFNAWEICPDKKLYLYQQ